MIADLHCHPTLSPFNTGADMWKSDPPKMRQRDNMINTMVISDFIQADFRSLGQGQVQLVFLSLYPIERGFVVDLFEGNPGNRTIVDIVKDGLTRIFPFGPPEQWLAKALFKMPARQYQRLAAENRDYFDDLEDEYNLLCNHISKGDTPYRIEIVSNFSQLKQLLRLDADYNPHPSRENIIAVVLTVEGAHALGCGQHSTTSVNEITEWESVNDLQHPQTAQLLARLRQNINKMKNWKGGLHCPLFVTFSHHFWNQLCGHSMSLANIMNKAFHQNPGMNRGMSRLGVEVLKDLLSDQNGRPVLIDIKHMSVDGRKWYYEFVRQYGRPVPIVASHMGVTGVATMTTNPGDHEAMDESYEDPGKPRVFNDWDVNLFDDEIVIIHQSRGLIGLNCDQRILTGKKMVDSITSISKRLVRDRKVKAEDLLYRSIWAEPILANWLHIVNVIARHYSYDPQEVQLAWQRVSIGSDFDGMINALDAYCHAEDFQRLRFVMIEKLRLRQNFEPILKDQNPEALVDGLLYKNALRFLDSNFNHP
jgi:microsomal dipeptidase-like Zn-dependent dipeptidase